MTLFYARANCKAVLPTLLALWLQEKVGLSPATTNIVMAAIPLVLAPLSFAAQRVGDIFGDQCCDAANSIVAKCMSGLQPQSHHLC